METIDKSKKSTSFGRSIENRQDQLLLLCRRMIVQALKDTYDSSKEVSFDAANYFISSEHEIVCGHVGLNHIKIREDVIEALRVGGVRKQRMINDIIDEIREGFKDD